MTFQLNDVYAIEGEVEVTEQEYFLSVQRAINGGMWSLQGSYGRTMMDAIKSGRCLLGPGPAQDAYLNRIPGRTEVKDGTTGSWSFVADEMGEDWATAMEGA